MSNSAVVIANMVKLGYIFYIPNEQEVLVYPGTLEKFLESSGGKSYSILTPIHVIAGKNATNVCGITMTAKEKEKIDKELSENNIFFKTGYKETAQTGEKFLLLKEKR